MAEYRDLQLLGRTEYGKWSDADAIGVIFTKPHTPLMLQQNFSSYEYCLVNAKWYKTGHRVDTDHPLHEQLMAWSVVMFSSYLKMIIVQLHWSTMESFYSIMRRTQEICTTVRGEPDLPRLSHIPLFIAATVSAYYYRISMQEVQGWTIIY